MIRIFNLNSPVNKTLQNWTIPPCEMVLVEGTNLDLSDDNLLI